MSHHPSIRQLIAARRKIGNSFAGALRRLRIQAGMTQKTLATKAKVSEDSIFLWEKGGRRPQAHAVRRLAKALRVTLEELKLTELRRFTTAQGEAVVTIDLVMDEMQWSSHRLPSVQQSCLYLDGKPLAFRWEHCPITGTHQQVIPAATLDLLEKGAREAKQGRFVYKGVPWLSTERSLLELNMPGCPPVRRANLLDWSRSLTKRCRILRRRLCKKHFSFEWQAGPSQAWYREKDILRIKRNLLKRAHAQRRIGNSFAGALRRIRIQAGMTHKTLATEVGVSSSAISMWEKGGRRPHPRAARRLAKALQVTPEELKLTKRPRKRSVLPQHTFDGVFKDRDGKVVAYNVRRTAKVVRCNTDRVYNHRRKLPKDLCSEELCRAFPDKRLPSELMRVPGTRIRQTAIRVENIATWQEGIDKILAESAMRAEGLATAAEILDQHGAEDYGDRILGGAYLHDLVEAGVLTGHRVPQRKRTCRRKWICPMLFDPSEIDRHLPGQSLVGKAREFASLSQAAPNELGVEQVEAESGRKEHAGRSPDGARGRRGPSDKVEAAADGDPARPDSGANGTKTPAVADGSKFSKIERALIILRRDPNKSNRAIAIEVGCAASLLSSDPTFLAAREALRGKVPKGSKGKDGTMEAEAENLAD